MEKNKCECDKEKVRIKARYFCTTCGKGIKTNTLSFRFNDDCTSGQGITDFDLGQFKIFRCDHYVYCPLCGWRCSSVEDLEKHIDIVGENGRHLCDGHWRYGFEGVQQVRNEIKYWKLYKKNEVSGNSPHK
ncbi:hypothetical protein LCGC14_2283950 [marine sediment metagenome]|uniref:Uncharacterized protein n=1 Tax=marine sediment metagenome TaxID=412755 RepID=A0A0F9FNF8_9ZZZZ